MVNYRNNQLDIMLGDIMPLEINLDLNKRMDLGNLLDKKITCRNEVFMVAGKS